jgi:hypothetical protein
MQFIVRLKRISSFVAARPISDRALNARRLIYFVRKIFFCHRVNVQSELNFGEDGSSDGYTQWLVGRKVATEIVARKIGLPLGHEVAVWLVGGVRLRGKLRLKEEALFIEEEHVRHLGLRVDKVEFTYREMESCVRLD